MPEPESRKGEPHREKEALPVYSQAVRYQDEQGAENAFFQAQDALFKTESELSAYRFQLEQIWHVAVLGEAPPADLDQAIGAILATGEPTSLPPDILTFLNQRRLQAKQLGPWVEGHYRPGKRLRP